MVGPGRLDIKSVQTYDFLVDDVRPHMSLGVWSSPWMNAAKNPRTKSPKTRGFGLLRDPHMSQRKSFAYKRAQHRLVHRLIVLV